MSANVLENSLHRAVILLAAVSSSQLISLEAAAAAAADSRAAFAVGGDEDDDGGADGNEDRDDGQHQDHLHEGEGGSKAADGAFVGRLDVHECRMDLAEIGVRKLADCSEVVTHEIRSAT